MFTVHGLVTGAIENVTGIDAIVFGGYLDRIFSILTKVVMPSGLRQVICVNV